MIHSVKVTSGFAKELFKRRVFKFKEGLNIIVGENGSGKSTLLGIAGAYSGVHRLKGWTTFPERPHLSWDERKNAKFEDRFAEWSPGKCKATVDWDGRSTIAYSPDTIRRSTISMEDLFHDQLFPETKMAMAMQMGSGNAGSAGQRCILTIKMLMERLAEAPDWSKRPKKVWQPMHGWMRPDQVNDHWTVQIDDMVKYVKSLPRDGQMTILLDEPDRSLSLPNQIEVWTRVIPAMTKHFQVIVATHSPFVLTLKNANFIEMSRGYMKLCRDSMDNAEGIVKWKS